jgi:type I restriction-modification system DNA methylase subunit
MNHTQQLFNRKILNKYLSAFSSEQVADYALKRKEMLKWKEAIEESDLGRTKERSVQGKFLVSVFEKVLGYSTLIEGREYNQKAEYKSTLDGSQADGALGFFTADVNIVRAVIELKDAKTNLDKKQQRSNHLTPVEQAFGYANKNGSGCGWVIVSNFVEIRLYKSSSSLEYEKFLLTELDGETEFKRFYFLLCKDNLIAKAGKSLVDKLYDDNEQAREEISNEFYRDYKKLRADLFRALKAHNPQIDEMTLFSKAQKILDRFIFICFCENRMLLPQGIFKSVIEAAQKSFDMTPNRLWVQLKGLFNSIDIGNPPMKINGYNGGLFKQDAVLDGLNITDDVLERFERLTSYDFGSDLNVNILGHIFEQSVSDIEQVKAEIAGIPYDRKKSKQKADAIFYTPEYVTKFIVEKTIGRWLNDEKEKIKHELVGAGGFTAVVGERKSKDLQSFIRGRKFVLKNWEEISDDTSDSDKNEAVVKLHTVFWERYTERLKSIRVLDPACGSGAFLNQAFDFLCKEGTYAVEMHDSLVSGQITLFDWDKHILQNNLFGVDLNIESVEITKLSLWLKTARQDRELAALDDNIKCGNSIINDPEIAEDKSFDWNTEFSVIMEQGGFDVVLGNPPYGATLSQAEKDYIAVNYETQEGFFDTYKTFFELGMNLTKEGGYLGYITPNTFFFLEKGGNKLRKFLFENYTMLDIVELFNVFPTAVVEPAITVFKNTPPTNDENFEVISVPRKTDLASTFIADGIKTVFEQGDLWKKEGYLFNYRETDTRKALRRKIDVQAKQLSEYFNVMFGVQVYAVNEGTPPQTKEIVESNPFYGYEKLDDLWKPIIDGRMINRFVSYPSSAYIKYGEWLARPRNPEVFANPKLVIRQAGDYPIATYDDSGIICKNTIYCIYPNQDNDSIELKYLLGIINSSLMKYVFRTDHFQMVGKVFAKILGVYIDRLPIAVADDQTPVISLVDKLLETCQARFDKAKQFTDYLTEIYSPKAISEKLSEFYKLDFKSFVGELKKQKVKLTPKQEMELMPLFQEKADELTTLSQTIDNLDTELDKLVFELYGLSEEEIQIIEGGV